MSEVSCDRHPNGCKKKKIFTFKWKEDKLFLIPVSTITQEEIYEVEKSLNYALKKHDVILIPPSNMKRCKEIMSDDNE